MASSARFDAVFASDVHLSPDHPATTDAFLRFIEQSVAGRTPRFFILGDLFEYWAGDDDLDDPLARRVVLALRALANRPLAKLASVSLDPVGAWRRDDAIAIRGLANLELRSAGIRRR